MNQNKIVNLLNRVLNSSGRKLKKQNEYMYWSPFVVHHKQKLQINIKTQKWHCWVSNEGGYNLFQLFKKVGASQKHFDELRDIVGETPYKQRGYENKEVKKKKKVELPKEFNPLWNGRESIVKEHALRYLSKRDIKRRDILKYNIGYCDSGTYSNRIIIPSYDRDGQLNYFVGRDFYKGKFKYRNPPISKNVIGFELFINWDEPIVLCEGPFDAISVKRNAIPLFGKIIPEKLKKKIYKNKVKSIYIALDSDAIVDSLKIAEEFMNNGIDIYFVNLTDKDPSEIGFDKFLTLKRNTEIFKFSDLVKLKLYGKKRKYMEI